MDINGLRELALQHGIIILDYEDPETIRQRIASQLGDDPEAVSDTTVAEVTFHLRARQEDIILLSETDEGEAAIQKAVCLAMADAGLVVLLEIREAEDEEEEENERRLREEDERLDALEEAYLNGEISRSQWANGGA